MGAGQARGAGLCSWGGCSPGCPPSSSANGGSRCPGMSWQEGPGPQSKQTPRRRLGEGQEAVFPLPSPTPAWPSAGGAWRGELRGPASIPLQLAAGRQGKTPPHAHPTPTPKSSLSWGLRSCSHRCQGTPRPSACPGHAAFAGRRASGHNGSPPQGPGAVWAAGRAGVAAGTPTCQAAGEPRGHSSCSVSTSGDPGRRWGFFFF